MVAAAATMMTRLYEMVDVGLLFVLVVVSLLLTSRFVSLEFGCYSALLVHFRDLRVYGIKL